MADGGWSAFSCCLDKKMKAGSSRHFCLSCRNFSREIINKACQQTLDSLRDTNGNLETGGQDIQELVFSELDKVIIELVITFYQKNLQSTRSYIPRSFGDLISC